MTYNSSSNSSSYTVIQYSTNNTFNSPSSSKIITNPSSGSLTVNTITDLGIYTTPTSVIYFRAYNSCSNGATSSYSNIITASCTEEPAPEFYPLTIQFQNLSGQSVEYILNNDSPITVINNFTRTFTSSLSAFNLDFSILGSNNYVGITDESGYYIYSMGVTGSNILNGNIITSVIPQIDSGNYPGSLIYPYSPAQNVQFASNGDEITTDVSIYIDRSSYSPSATIKLTINNGV